MGQKHSKYKHLFVVVRLFKPLRTTDEGEVSEDDVMLTKAFYEQEDAEREAARLDDLNEGFLALLSSALSAWSIEGEPMDLIDEKLLPAWLLALENVTDANEAELNALLPALIEAGLVEEKPWGDDPEWFLWWFTEAGVKRSKELEASGGNYDSAHA